MATVGADEAKTHLLRLLDRVARGERITITRHGVPVAELVPAGPKREREIRDVLREIRRLRKGRTLSREEVREMLEEGRRS
ncbi:MAG: type II toxin-antitoxin system Phd/YefM family antitoxin [Planctomycetota bacterium]|jgi:prevent-host-death family protein